ncbi:hypothetical protein [Hymenobacter sp.]|uniref:hypothetical protein n=1 Tax=Hymenobacter sp. TaxID=1898978 RepID=UPI00286C2A53|nr:hypothetical protein [Hymenobacter sp.]
MEAPAPARGPRNLAAPLAAWLRTLGFTATEYGTTVAAHWVGAGGEHFQFDYAWAGGPTPAATCRLRVLYTGQHLFDTCFTAQKIRRLKEARLLLLGNVRYANARLLALSAPV